MMQQNGIKREDGRGRVSRVSETGIKIEGKENWLSFSKPEYRKEPFEIPIVGDFVEYRYAKKGAGTWVQSINVLGSEEPIKNGLPLNNGQRKNESTWEEEREKRLMELLKIISENYSGRALGPEDLMRDAILLEREFVRALKRWRE